MKEDGNGQENKTKFISNGYGSQFVCGIDESVSCARMCGETYGFAASGHCRWYFGAIYQCSGKRGKKTFAKAFKEGKETAFGQKAAKCQFCHYHNKYLTGISFGFDFAYSRN